jgi:ubiquinone/menaquinone biosynthesis C-methylase UbiE
LDSRLQGRIQRYGWDLASAAYENCWYTQLHPLRDALLAALLLEKGAKVLDVACGSGALSIELARAVGPTGFVTGLDISEQMVVRASEYALEQNIDNVRFTRMDAQKLDVEPSSYDVILCSLGLMYVTDVTVVLKEMRRALAPGGRIVFAVWGSREACGWSGIFDVIQAEVKSQVCPTFFQLGGKNAAAEACSVASLRTVSVSRLVTVLRYTNDALACDAATLGGPVALAWSRFDEDTKARVRAQYLDTLKKWRSASGYLVPAEFVIVSAAC